MPKWSLRELAEQAAVPERTIRFYIARGLAPGPAGAGRGAAYGPEHLERLEAIKKLQAQGLMLAQIERALSGEKTARSLPEASAWWSYPVDSDVVVWVRQGLSPWRTRQVRAALEELAARLGKEEEDSGSG